MDNSFDDDLYIETRFIISGSTPPTTHSLSVKERERVACVQNDDGDRGRQFSGGRGVVLSSDPIYIFVLHHSLSAASDIAARSCRRENLIAVNRSVLNGLLNYIYSPNHPGSRRGLWQRLLVARRDQEVNSRTHRRVSFVRARSSGVDNERIVALSTTECIKE